MKKFTMVIDDQEMKLLKSVYHEHLTRGSTQLIFFGAVHNNVEITCYNTGKLLLEGENVKNEIILVKKVLNHSDFEAIGSDEYGGDDLFGPITVCAAHVTLDDIEFLEELDIQDPKVINDRFVIKHAPKIAKRLTHSLIILDPVKYNLLIDEGYNLNRIKAHLHNQAIVSLTSKVQNRDIPVIVDQFCQPQLYYNYLKEEILIYRDVQFYVKAENIHLSVAAANIISRYAYLYSMQKANKVAGMKLVKGSSKRADDQVEKLLEKHDPKVFLKIAKKNFKNLSKLDL